MYLICGDHRQQSNEPPRVKKKSAGAQTDRLNPRPSPRPKKGLQGAILKTGRHLSGAQHVAHGIRSALLMSQQRQQQEEEELREQQLQVDSDHQQEQRRVRSGRHLPGCRYFLDGEQNAAVFQFARREEERQRADAGKTPRLQLQRLPALSIKRELQVQWGPSVSLPRPGEPPPAPPPPGHNMKLVDVRYEGGAMGPRPSLWDHAAPPRQFPTDPVDTSAVRMVPVRESSYVLEKPTSDTFAWRSSTERHQQPHPAEVVPRDGSAAAGGPSSVPRQSSTAPQEMPRSSDVTLQQILKARTGSSPSQRQSSTAPQEKQGSLNITRRQVPKARRGASSSQRHPSTAPQEQQGAPDIPSHQDSNAPSRGLPGTTRRPGPTRPSSTQPQPPTTQHQQVAGETAHQRACSAARSGPALQPWRQEPDPRGRSLRRKASPTRRLPAQKTPASPVRSVPEVPAPRNKTAAPSVRPRQRRVSNSVPLAAAPQPVPSTQGAVQEEARSHGLESQEEVDGECGLGKLTETEHQVQEFPIEDYASQPHGFTSDSSDYFGEAELQKTEDAVLEIIGEKILSDLLMKTVQQPGRKGNGTTDSEEQHPAELGDDASNKSQSLEVTDEEINEAANYEDDFESTNEEKEEENEEILAEAPPSLNPDVQIKATEGRDDIVPCAQASSSPTEAETNSSSMEAERLHRDDKHTIKNSKKIPKVTSKSSKSATVRPDSPPSIQSSSAEEKTKSSSKAAAQLPTYPHHHCLLLPPETTARTPSPSPDRSRSRRSVRVPTPPKTPPPQEEPTVSTPPPSPEPTHRKHSLYKWKQLISKPLTPPTSPPPIPPVTPTADSEPARTLRQVEQEAPATEETADPQAEPTLLHRQSSVTVAQQTDLSVPHRSVSLPTVRPSEHSDEAGGQTERAEASFSTISSDSPTVSESQSKETGLHSSLSCGEIPPLTVPAVFLRSSTDSQLSTGEIPPAVFRQFRQLAGSLSEGEMPDTRLQINTSLSQVQMGDQEQVDDQSEGWQRELSEGEVDEVMVQQDDTDGSSFTTSAS